MSIDKKFLDLFTKVTEKAAIGASKFVGKKDKIAADKGAVDPMRRELNKISMEGTVVIGEGEMDEAPMLYIGEKLGTLNGPKFDIAVDPLEGTKFTANGEPNAFSVLAISEQGGLLSAPDTYMEKIVIGSNLPKNIMDIDNGVEKNIKLLAEAKNKKINELNACVLKRDRHKHIVETLTEMKVKINYITDGDIAGALSVIGENPKKMMAEQLSFEWDKKYWDNRRGRVLNKHARYNVCFGEKSVDANFEQKQGTIIGFERVPILKNLKESLGGFFGDKAKELEVEGNLYYNIRKCGIGFHGDSERKRVIACSLGASRPIHWQWYHQSKPIGRRLKFEIGSGDIYIMSEKASGFDWKRRSQKTLRHAAGEKYVK